MPLQVNTIRTLTGSVAKRYSLSPGCSSRLSAQGSCGGCGIIFPPEVIVMIGFRKSHAVIIGIDEYRNGIPPLRTAVNDALRISELLEVEFHGYTVHRLTEDVTLDRLRTFFRETLPHEIEGGDRLLVYFAGHGIALDSNNGPAGYLIPQDARQEDRGSFLPMTELSGWLERLPCRHMLLILDCCFAGAYRWSNTRDLEPLPDVIYRERFDRYILDPAWQVLTSAAYDQKALDVLSGETIGFRGQAPWEGKHSPFAAALLQGLQGEADLVPSATAGRPAGDGVITATELYLYLRECVEARVGRAAHRQTPGLWPMKRHDKGEFIHLVPGHPLNLPPAPDLIEVNNPYRGLQPYEEEHAPLFFGRSKFVAALAERVQARPLTVVLGASGTGKSSVVKAGLLPSLRCGNPGDWQIMPPFRPGSSPLSTMAALTLPGERGGPDAITARLDAAHSDPDALARRVAAWAATNPSRTSQPSRLLVVVDQFEELLTLCRDAAESERFLVQFDRALAMCPDRLRVVLTLRSGFEPHFARSPLKEEWVASRVVVPVMTLDEYRDAIERSAAVKVLYFRGKESSHAFIDRLIGDVASTPGALALLSFTLSELYRSYLAHHRSDRSLTEEDYEALGGVGGSLTNRAAEIYRDLPDDAHRATMRRVMLRMVSVEGGELARRRVLDGELEYAADAENDRVREVVRRLTEARLVVGGKDDDDQPFVEPAHDELVRGWDTLLSWSRAGQEQLVLLRLVTPAAYDWVRGQGGLWHANPRLNLLQRIHRSDAYWFNKTECDFVERSIARRRTILRGTITAVSAAVVTLAVLTVLALLSRSQAIERANVSRSRELAARAESDLGRRLDRALLLAVEAVRSSDTFEARSSLYKALTARPGLVTFLHSREGPVRGLVFSPDGKTLVVGQRGGVVLWDVMRRRQTTRPITLNEGIVPGVVFTRQGRILAVGDYRGPSGYGVALWEVESSSPTGAGGTGVLLYAPTVDGVPATLSSVAFSPDGRTIAASFNRIRVPSQVMLWDTSGRPLVEEPLIVAEGSIMSLTFSPDGKILAAGYDGATNDGVVLWRAPFRERLSEVPLIVDSDVTDVAFSPDGKTLAAGYGGYRTGVALWDVASWQRSGEPLTLPEGNASCLSFSRDGKTLAVGFGGRASGGGVVLWDAVGRQRLTEKPLTIPEGDVSAVAFTPDGRALAAGFGGGVVVWDVVGRQVTKQRLAVGEPNIAGVTFSPDGRALAASFDGGVNRGVVVWDVASGRRRTAEPLTSANLYISNLAFDPDGRTLAAEEAKGVVLWDVASRRRLMEVPLPVSEGIISTLAFSPTGKALAIGFIDRGGDASGGVVLWNVAGKRWLTDEPLAIREGSTSSLAFSRDGKTLAAGFGKRYSRGGNGVVLWDLASRQRLANGLLTVPEGSVNDVVFTPDCQTLAASFSGNDHGGLILWDLTGRRLVQEPLVVAEGWVSGVAISPDSQVLAAGVNSRNRFGNDGGLVLWDVPGRRRLVGQPLAVASGVVRDVTFGPDGRTLATAGIGSRGDSRAGLEIHLWDFIPVAMRTHRAGQIANRNLSLDEWHDNFGPEAPYHRTFDDLPDGDRARQIDPNMFSLFIFILIIPLWMFYWFRLVSWPRFSEVLSKGGWVTVGLLAVYASAVWGLVTGPVLLGGAGVMSSIGEKSLFILFLALLSALSGHLQVRFGLRPLGTTAEDTPLPGKQNSTDIVSN